MKVCSDDNISGNYIIKFLEKFQKKEKEFNELNKKYNLLQNSHKLLESKYMSRIKSQNMSNLDIPMSPVSIHSSSPSFSSSSSIINSSIPINLTEDSEPEIEINKSKSKNRKPVGKPPLKSSKSTNSSSFRQNSSETTTTGKRRRKQTQQNNQPKKRRKLEASDQKGSGSRKKRGSYGKDESVITCTPIEFIELTKIPKPLHIPETKCASFLNRIHNEVRQKSGFIQRVQYLKKQAEKKKYIDDWTFLYYTFSYISIEILGLTDSLKQNDRRLLSDLLNIICSKSMGIRRSSLQKCCITSLTRCMFSQSTSLRRVLVNRMNSVFKLFQTSQTKGVRCCCDAFFEIITGTLDVFKDIKKMLTTYMNQPRSCSEIQRNMIIEIMSFYLQDDSTVEYANFKGETVIKKLDRENYYQKHKQLIHETLLEVFNFGAKDKSEIVRENNVNLFQQFTKKDKIGASKIRKKLSIIAQKKLPL